MLKTYLSMKFSWQKPKFIFILSNGKKLSISYNKANRYGLKIRNGYNLDSIKGCCTLLLVI